MKQLPRTSWVNRRDSLRHKWMASRYAYRARQAVKFSMLSTANHSWEGPVAQLREEFPGSEIVVDFTGKDGDHEQFVYVVKDGELVDRSRRALTVP